MILLGIDYGTKRTGLAITDELEIIASPLKAVAGGGAGIGEIRKVVAERGVQLVVVGMPLNMDGSVGPAGKAVQAFVEKLRAELPVPVETFDERLTTAQAERSMLMHDLSRAKRAGRRDEMAAQIMLQCCVDARKKGRR